MLWGLGDMMDYDYLTSIISNYSNITSLSNQKTNALSGASYIKDAMNKMGQTSSSDGLQASTLTDALKSASLSGALQSSSLSDISELSSLSGILNPSLKDAAFSDVLSAALAAEGVDDDMAEKLTDLAGAAGIKGDVAEASEIRKRIEEGITAGAGSIENDSVSGLSSGIEGEARSNLIMQNYIYAALMKDTLENSLSDKADFTSMLFQGLAVGAFGGSNDDNSSSGGLLSTLTDNTLSAISNMSAYQELLGEEN